MLNQVYSTAYDLKPLEDLTVNSCCYYQTTKKGPEVRRCYLANKSKQITVVLEFGGMKKDPLIKLAMEYEIRSF